MGFPDGTVLKNPFASAGDTGELGLIPGLGRALGVENDNLLQYSCLKNCMDRGAWWATVRGVAESQTRLSMGMIYLSLQSSSSHPKHFTMKSFKYTEKEKEM